MISYTQGEQSLDCTANSLERINIELNGKYTENEVMNRELTLFLNASGKRIRSSLVLLYLQAFGADITDEIIQLLTAGELIHNASLLHDDVIDEAEIRRNNITFAYKFSPKISILLGDILLSFAVEKLMQLNNKLIFDLFINCTKKMGNIEITHFLMRCKKPDLEKYLEICEAKTACLFETMLEGAAILANLDRVKAKKYAKTFGILFQLKNDLEYKSAENDKKNGIYTARDIIGIEKTNILIDNYCRELNTYLKDLPENNYTEMLKDMLG